MKLPPAPWYVDPDYRPDMEWNNHVLSADGNTVCFMAHNPDDNEAHENAAYAIAAIPDLLEAAKEFVAKVERGEARSKQSYAAFKAAIAKAEGKQ